MKKQIYTMMGAALMAAMTLPAMAQNTVVSFENQALNEDGYWIGEENENGVSDGYGGMTPMKRGDCVSIPLTVFTIGRGMPSPTVRRLPTRPRR